jgi:hypothetical protein
MGIMIAQSMCFIPTSPGTSAERIRTVCPTTVATTHLSAYAQLEWQSRDVDEKKISDSDRTGILFHHRRPLSWRRLNSGAFPSVDVDYCS